MAYQVVTAVPSAARAASGTGQNVLGADTGDTLSLQLNVTAASGTTPTLAVNVEWSMDGGVTFAQAETPDAFTQVTGTGNKVKTFTAKAPAFRLVWTIGGTTPSFTFAVLAYTTT